MAAVTFFTSPSAKWRARSSDYGSLAGDAQFTAEFQKRATTAILSTLNSFLELDVDPFGVELAKVTLMLAKKLALDEAAARSISCRSRWRSAAQMGLPLDNLDDNIRCEDALFAEWPEIDAIVGNPPYQSKNKLQGEMARAN